MCFSTTHFSPFIVVCSGFGLTYDMMYSSVNVNYARKRAICQGRGCFFCQRDGKKDFSPFLRKRKGRKQNVSSNEKINGRKPIDFFPVSLYNVKYGNMGGFYG
jgi:hypothetical protein